MPHKGFSFFRLKEHFRKFWAIYIVGFIFCGFMSNLLYTTTAPRTPIEQEVKIYLADNYTKAEAMDAVAKDMLAYGQTFDDTLLEVNFESLVFTDPEYDYSGMMVLMTRMAVGEGDAYVACAACAEHLLKSEIYQPLDEYIANGWLEGIEYETVSYTSQETGVTSIAGIRLDNFNTFSELGAITNRDAVLVIPCNSTNLETTMETVDYMLRNMTEGKYAPAESSESAS